MHQTLALGRAARYIPDMAGKPLTRERLKDAEERVEQLEAELRSLKAQSPPATPHQAPTFTPREYNKATKDHLIADMLTQCDEAATVDEIAASWNVEGADVLGWAEADVQFATALRRGRTRARAAINRMVRNALKSGRALPGSVMVKLEALYPAGELEGADDASEVVHVHSMPPADCGSAEPSTQAVDPAQQCAT